MESRPIPSRPAPRIARSFGLWLAGSAMAAATVYYVIPLAGRGIVRAIQMLVAGCISLATSMAVGASMSDVFGTVARAAIASLITPTGSLALSILVVVAVVAFYALQRVLESEEESSS